MREQGGRERSRVCVVASGRRSLRSLLPPPLSAHSSEPVLLLEGMLRSCTRYGIHRRRRAGAAGGRQGGGEEAGRQMRI